MKNSDYYLSSSLKIQLDRSFFIFQKNNEAN